MKMRNKEQNGFFSLIISNSVDFFFYIKRTKNDFILMNVSKKGLI